MPHQVTKGSQKNYEEFFKNMSKKLKDNDFAVDNIFFENLIAMAILFKTAEKEYGTGNNAIGDLRFMVVPYTLSYINQKTEQKIDLYKIWKNQDISDNLRTVLIELLHKIDLFLRKSAKEFHGGLISEWAKKEDCWKKMVEQDFDVDFLVLKADFEQKQNRQKKTETEIEALEKEKIVDELKNTPSNLWKKIIIWGRENEHFSAYKLGILEEVSRLLAKNKALEALQIKNAKQALDFAFEQAPELFLDNEDVEDELLEERPLILINHELLERLLLWGKKSVLHLSDKQYNFVKKVKQQSSFSEYQQKYLQEIVQKATTKGFR